MSDVLVENAGAVAIVTLNRPAQMNALSASVRAGLAEAFRGLDADDTVKAVVLTGAGEKAFCAGLDLKELGAGDASPLAIIEGEDDPVATLLRCRKPIVGAINGVAITGGFELALACDVLIASTEARFADTHGLVGIMPGWGLSARLSRIVGISRAKAMSLTGTFIDANTAMVWGLVNRVTKPADLLPLALQIAGNMAMMPAETLIEYKRLIDDGYGLPFREALELEANRSSAFNAKVTGADIEARRAAVQARGQNAVARPTQPPLGV